jgi:uncharacterized protein YdeI (YjbR/CyaY-like superfamily)
MTKAPPNSVHPQSREEWRWWLEQNQRRAEGVWLISYKKATGKARFDYGAAVEEALCFGWIDSKPNKLDSERSMLWFAPRKLGTGWSRPNKLRAEEMIRTGRMAAAGLAKIEAAKQDGSWARLDAVENLEIPGDLAAALSSIEAAAANFAGFPRSVKRGILEWIAVARKPATRAARIEETARLAARNLRANQWNPAAKKQDTSPPT